MASRAMESSLLNLNSEGLVESVSAGIGEVYGSAGGCGFDPVLGEQAVGDCGAEPAGEMVALL